MASDNATPTAATAEETITIAVNEVNSPPTVDSLATTGPFDSYEDVLVDFSSDPSDQTITFTATATDPDTPAQTLTFSLVNPPTGTTYQPTITTAGDFSWTLTPEDAPATYNVTLQVEDEGSLAGQRTVRFVVATAEPMIYIENVVVSEDSGLAAFTVSLSLPANQDVTVQYDTADDTALAGSDYDAQNATLTFTPGQTSKTVNVVVTDDSDVESSESFFLNLSNAVGATIGDAQGVGTIADDEPADSGGWVSYGEASVSGNMITLGVAGEGEFDTQTSDFHGASLLLQPNASYTVDFTPDLSTWDSYNADVGSGTGYWDSFSLSVTSLPYNQLSWSDPVDFPFVWGGDDYSDSLLETYTTPVDGLVFSGDASGDNYLNVVLDTVTAPTQDEAYPSWGTVTITSSLPLATQLVVEDYALGEREGQAYFVVRRLGPDSGAVTVDYATADGDAVSGADYSSTSDTLNFASGETVKVVSVPILNDAVIESTETFSLQLSNASGATIVDDTGVATIIDDDPESFGAAIYPPIAHDDGVDEFGAYLYTVSHSDTFDPAESVLINDVFYGAQQTVEVTANPSDGQLTLDAQTGTWSYDPDDAFAGIDSFQYKFTDDSLASNIATVTIEVTNELPTAADEEYRVIEGGDLNVDAAAGLLANDFDSDAGDDLDVASLQSRTGVTLGTLNVDVADGSFTYQANVGASGGDDYTYYVTDHIDNSPLPAMVTVNVLEVNVDIDVDANYDGFIDAADDAIEADAPGRFLALGGDVVTVELNREFIDNLYANVLQEMDLTAVELDGFKLSLSGDASQIKIWEFADKTAEILLGDFIYSGGAVSLPETVYVEGVGLGSSTLTLEFKTSGDVVLASDSILLNVFNVDLDVDSDNLGGLDEPADDPAEDAIEDDSSADGKYLGVNDGDLDNDGVPDYADGYNLDELSGTSDDSIGASGPVFTPIVVRLPAGIDPNLATLSFSYDASDPLQVTPNETDFGDQVEYAYQRPPNGGTMRIWTTDATTDRDPHGVAVDGDYIQPNVAYSVADLGGGSKIVLYIEGITPSTAIAADQISVTLNPVGSQASDPSAAPTATDTVRTTIVTVDADVDSDNDGVLERDPFEDHIEQLSNVQYPGKTIAITDDPSKFTPYVVEIPSPTDMSSAELIFDFDDTLVQIWGENSLTIEPGITYQTTDARFDFLGGRIANLTIQGFQTLLGTSTTITATVRNLLAGAAAFLQADGVKADGGPYIEKVEFINPAGLPPLGQLTSPYGYGELRAGKNPSDFGGGDIFFPGLRNEEEARRTEKKLRNVVRVRATIKGDNVKEGIEVWFRAFDVDDPSSESAIDANDDNGPTGRDNRGRVSSAGHPTLSDSTQGGGYRGRLRQPFPEDQFLPGTFQKEGELVKGVVFKKGNAFYAEVDLLTTFTPGDNFRVVATLLGADVDIKDYNDTTDIPTTGTGPANSSLSKHVAGGKGGITDQLSVWRYLHIEIDQMEKTISADHVKGLARGAVQGPIGSDTFLIRTNIAAKKDQYDGGLLRGMGRNFVIVGNTAGLNATFTLSGNVPAAALAAIMFPLDIEVFEDDFTRVDGNPNAYPVTRVDPSDKQVLDNMTKFLKSSTDVKVNRYADAYIMPIFETLVEDSGSKIPATPHMSIDDLLAYQKRYAGSADAASQLFWVSYIMSAYEGGKNEDKDPTTENALLGTTLLDQSLLPLEYMHAVSAIFVEPHYDRYFHSIGGSPIEDATAYTTVHEIGHQFNLVRVGMFRDKIGHREIPTNNIMTSSYEPIFGMRFHPRDVSDLRWNIYSPGKFGNIGRFPPLE